MQSLCLNFLICKMGIIKTVVTKTKGAYIKLIHVPEHRKWGGAALGRRPRKGIAWCSSPTGCSLPHIPLDPGKEGALVTALQSSLQRAHITLAHPTRAVHLRLPCEGSSPSATPALQASTCCVYLGIPGT